MRYFGRCTWCEEGLHEWYPVFEGSNILAHFCTTGMRYFYDGHYFLADMLDYWVQRERRSRG